MNPYKDNIAIIGLAGRFPKATLLSEFWHNIQTQNDCLSTFSEHEMAKDGIPKHLRQKKDYINRKGIIKGLPYFDYTFFKYAKKEAEIIDPQQRILLSIAWEALQDANITPDSYQGTVGVFCGTGRNDYFDRHVKATLDPDDPIANYNAYLANDKEFAATRIAYKLNLKGPAITVQSACSTSLVAIHLACQSLLSQESDLCLAGAASCSLPTHAGYEFREHFILSKSGQVAPFDENADGTLFSQGAGMIALKRLEDALRDQDPIYASIICSKINNDGKQKMGFTAPSLSQQSDLIKRCLIDSQIDPKDCTLMETHGTGTRLGDPIEFNALRRAFPEQAQPHCAIGAIKGHIGHTDTAAAVIGLIKTCLNLKFNTITPLCHFKQANSHLELDNSPFYFPNSSMPLNDAAHQFAGINALGVGGTNAHLLLAKITPDTQTGIQARPFISTQPRQPNTSLSPSYCWLEPTISQEDKLVNRPSYPKPKSILSKSEHQQIWNSLLGEPIHDHSDFFELGGDSMLAIQLIEQLKQKYAINISAEHLLAQAKFMDFHNSITQQMPIAWSKELYQQTPLLSTLKNPKSKDLLFLIHPIGGHSLFYKALSDHLNTSEQVISIRSSGLHQNEVILNSIPEMAQHYLTVIYDHYGPHANINGLIGASFGGLVAYEMACQLSPKKQIPFIGLIDTPSPKQFPKLPSNTSMILYDIFQHWLNIDKNTFHKLHEEAAIEQLKKELTQHHQIQISSTQLNQLIQVFMANQEAMINYEPLKTPMKLHYYKAKTRRPIDPESPEAWWKNIGDPFQLTQSPGDHISMNKAPHVQQLASYIDQDLCKKISMTTSK